MEDRSFLAIMAVVGLVIGAAAFQLTQQDTSQRKYCNQVESDLRSNQSFNGTVACFPPGVLNVDVNESSDVVNRTNLQCVCRRSHNGEEQIFTIRRAR